MIRGVLLALAGVALSSSVLCAQDLSGTWQGTMAGGRQVVLKISAAGKGFKGDFFNLGQEASGSPLNGNPVSITAKAKAVSFVLDRSREKFDGALSADGKSIAGLWQAGGAPIALSFRQAGSDAWVIDPSPHKLSFIAVDKATRLEVLDWGGSGRAVILLAGLGHTAHDYDAFAPKLAGKYHVYGITRRGIGLSSFSPPTDENYNADRLADDVLSVMAALKLERPVLVGQSIGAEVLSSIGSRFPEKVAGLIYLDGSYAYSFYDPHGNSLDVDYAVLLRDLKALPGAGYDPARAKALAEEVQATMPLFAKDLDEYKREGMPIYEQEPPTPQSQVMTAMAQGERKYTKISAPILAIVAEPPACAPNCDKPEAKAAAAADKAQADAFAAGNPAAKMVRLAHANHHIFVSNEAEVLSAMDAFLAGLPGP